MIDIVEGAKITIKDNVTLNSTNKGYHLNLSSPVKLMADRPGAKIIIGENTRIHGTCLHAYKRITIGKDCLIAGGCQIFDGNGHDLSFENPANRLNTNGSAKPVVIKDNVWIGAHVLILPGVCIGQGAVVAAGSVVTKNVPPMTLAGGNPATVIRDYSHN